MRRRTKILLVCGTLAAVTAFGGWAAAQNAGLRCHRGDAGRISASSFEETVRAVDALAEALHKSVYATDGGMCARICGEAYAEASAAGSAMLALPGSLTLQETRRLICKSPGQRDTACYAFFCQDAEGSGVTVYVDAATGRQCRIEF